MDLKQQKTRRLTEVMEGYRTKVYRVMLKEGISLAAVAREMNITSVTLDRFLWKKANPSYRTCVCVKRFLWAHNELTQHELEDYLQDPYEDDPRPREGAHGVQKIN